MKKRHLLFISILLMLNPWSCKKKLFRHVEVKGTLIDYFTNQPIPSSVSLSGDDGNEKNAQPAISLKTVKTDGNGNFTIKTNAVRTGNYYLSFHSLNMNPLKGWYENIGKIDTIKIPDGATKDFGQLFESTHTFYCIVTINHTSGLPYDFYITMPYDKSIWYKYPAASTNTFVHNLEYSKTDYEVNNHNYIFHYNLIGPSIVGGGNVSVPIQNNKDTVYATINY